MEEERGVEEGDGESKSMSRSEDSDEDIIAAGSDLRFICRRGVLCWLGSLAVLRLGGCWLGKGEQEEDGASEELEGRPRGKGDEGGRREREKEEEERREGVAGGRSKRWGRPSAAGRSLMELGPLLQRGRRRNTTHERHQDHPQTTLKKRHGTGDKTH